MRSLDQRQRFGSHLGLERISRLCAALGNPQQRLRTVHVAGTNGKGSVAAFVNEVLHVAGYRVGLYTSPHLVDFGERFQVNGQPIGPTELDRLLIEIEEYVDQIEAEYPAYGPITHFEVATALGFCYLAQQDTDIALIEVGLGGRLDATNVIAPEVSVITSIGYDHMEYLGDTLTAIATEKAGIIKPGVPVVLAPQSEEADKAVADVAVRLQAPLLRVGPSNYQAQAWDARGGTLQFPPWGSQAFTIGMLGRFQLDNAATALMVLKVLQERGLALSSQAVYQGMRQARWPGRMELIHSEPWLMVDCAHNQQGLAALAESLTSLLHGEKLTFVCALLENKDAALLDPLLPLAKRFIFTRPTSSRIPPKDPQVLASYVEHRGVRASTAADVASLFPSLAQEARVCVCGSLYLVADVKRYCQSNA